MSVLVTGASGFVGSRLLKTLQREGLSCFGMVRDARTSGDYVSGNLEDVDSLRLACKGITTVFHCAGYAHVFSSSGDDVQRHWRTNFEGTRNLIQAAVDMGVRRLVFLSSVKAIADSGNLCVAEDFPGEPSSDYGRAKRAAEALVLEAGQQHGMHVVNLRLAMVYGFGGRGNLERMGHLVGRGFFPPLPETGNHRSLVHVEDVINVMRLVADDDRANGKTYIVASPEAISGRALFNLLRAVQGLPPCAWSVPAPLLRTAARFGDGLKILIGRRMPINSEVLERLLGSAWYSARRIEEELGWRAKILLSEGLSEMLQR